MFVAGPSLLVMVILLVFGFVLYDAFDVAIGAWIVFGALMLGAFTRLISWIAGGHPDLGRDGS